MATIIYESKMETNGKWHSKQLEPIVIYFGLCNSLATFQAFIDNVFHEQKQKGGLLIYINNLLIMS